MPVSLDRIGVCSWSLRPQDPRDLVAQLADVGLRKVQLALNPLRDPAGPWADASGVLRDAGVTVVSGMFGTVGEDYSTLDTIRRTGGVVPDQHWSANRAIAVDVAGIARRMNVPVVSFHAGFIPHRDAAGYDALLDRLRTLGRLFADHGLTLLLETGQETADDLLTLLGDLGAPSVGVNFDPANMILYDKGDPIASLRKLLPHVRQVHVKDAVRATRPGEWGAEVPVGQGQVDWAAFRATLADAGYTGDYVIEREAGATRVADVRAAVGVLSR